jgi:hypothetical protein
MTFPMTVLFSDDRPLSEPILLQGDPENYPDARVYISFWPKKEAGAA